MANSWCVVQFDDGLQVVAKNWICGNQCYWPSFTGVNSTHAYAKAVKACKEPGTDWTLCPVRILGYYDDCNRAYSKLKLAEQQSDINTDDDTTRKRIRRKKHFPQSDSEEENEEDDERHFGSIKPFPVPDMNKNQSNVYVSTPSRKTSLTSSKHASTSQGSPSVVPSQPMSSLPEHENIDEDDDNDGAIDFPTTYINDEEFKKFVVKNLTFLKIQMKKLGADMRKNEKKPCDACKQQLRVEDPAEDDSIFWDNFPLKTMEDIQTIEDKLLNQPDYKKMMLFHFKRIGGNKLDGTIKAMLQRLLTDQLASAHNWEGKKQKKAFSSLVMKDVILKCIRDSKFFSTEKDAVDCIKNWLRHASARNINKQKRQDAASAQAVQN